MAYQAWQCTYEIPSEVPVTPKKSRRHPPGTFTGYTTRIDREVRYFSLPEKCTREEVHQAALSVGFLLISQNVRHQKGCKGCSKKTDGTTCFNIASLHPIPREIPKLTLDRAISVGADARNEIEKGRKLRELNKIHSYESSAISYIRKQFELERVKVLDGKGGCISK